jgi:hypothetical protein
MSYVVELQKTPVQQEQQYRKKINLAKKEWKPTLDTSFEIPENV